jgi:hypothetical protein
MMVIRDGDRVRLISRGGNAFLGCKRNDFIAMPGDAIFSAY